MTEAVVCIKCGKSVDFPCDATTWIKRAEFMDSLKAQGWTIEVFRQLCPDCREASE